MARPLSRPYLLLTLTALFWSGNMVMGRGIRADVPPIALAFWRWTICLMLVAPLAWPHLRSQWPLLRQAWPAVILLGTLGVGCYNTFAYLALQHTTATSAALINSFIPVATIAFAMFFFGKRLLRGEILGVLASLAGVLLIVSQGRLGVLLGLELNTGDLWMLLAVTTWGLYTAGLQLRPPGVHPMLMLAAFTLVGLIVLAPAYSWELLKGRHIVLTPASLGGILYTGIFPGFLGYVFYNAGVAAVGPARASLFIHLMPVFSIALAALFLGERPLWYHFAGIALVFGGIYLTTRRQLSG